MLLISHIVDSIATATIDLKDIENNALENKYIRFGRYY